MEKHRPIFLAFAVILALAMAGSPFSADARLAEWNFPLEPSEQIATQVNVLGDSAGQLVEVSGRLPQSLDAPLNGQYSEVPVGHNSAKAIGGQEVELLPGFDLINGMSQPYGVEVQCYNDAIPRPIQILVDQIVPTGQRDGWDLHFIDPFNPHVLYRCSYTVPDTNPQQEVVSESWVSLANQDQHRLPFYCVRCIFKVLDDGLYLYNINVKLFVKISDWDYVPKNRS